VGITLDWLGTATFRLTIGDLVVFLDAYMDRVAAAPPIGMRAGEVRRADFVLVGHSHFDHLAGAEVIADNTGARIIGSNESCRVMRERGVPREQLLPSQGGERHRLADGVTVRVFPSLHACTWVPAATTPGGEESGEVLSGHTGLTQEERAALPGLNQRIGEIAQHHPEIREHIRASAGSIHDGGALVYLIETPMGSIYYQDTSGCWTGVLGALRADAAILAASGRANIDGEPIQGSMAQFIAREALMLHAKTVVLGHHDDWMPPVTRRGFDMEPVRRELAASAPAAKLLEQGYLAGTVIEL
jgi:L-ascorbate metabolism protein UlaG (beta-lactamase superfamily)